MPLGLHWYDLALLLLLAILLFGAKRLPQMGNALGATIREFKRSLKDVPPATPTEALPANARANAQLSATPTANEATRGAGGQDE